jgi:hypothetical protein
MATRSVYLGQFTWEHSNLIAEQLEKAGIDWSYKQAGAITRVLSAGDWGVRLFVDGERLEDARRIVAAVPEPPSGSP